jgi:hypothetical protein
MKSRLVRLAALAAVFALFPALVLPPATQAQGVFDMGALTDTLSGTAGANAKKGAAPSPPVAVVKSSFVQSPERTKKNLAQFIAKTREAGNADGATQMEQVFSQPNFMSEIAKAIAPSGLKTNDAADAMTLWWIVAWNAANGRTDTPPPATFAAVKAQVKRAFGSTPAFSATTDAEKQELSEAMLIQGLLLDAASEQAIKQGGPMAAQVADAALKGARESYGFDLNAMTLTPQGFTKK